MASHYGRQTSVDPLKALKLFNLPDTANLRDLNAAYRRVVRKYHPDYNPERTEWAHEAMIKINAAYDSALEHLAALRYEEVEKRLDHEIRAHDRFTDIFLSVANSVLEGIFIYYQYGLENPFAREHGVPRFRYRLALKKIAAGIGQLERLTSPNSVDTETLETFCSFAIAFLQCMRLNRTHDPSRSREETIAYRHYRNGSQMLDETIRVLLFRDELAPTGRRAAPHSLPVAQAAFMKVLTEHAGSSWVTEAAIKSYLLDTVQKLDIISDRVPELRIGN